MNEPLRTRRHIHASVQHVLRGGGHRALRPPLRRLRPCPGPDRGRVGQGHPGEVPGQRRRGLQDARRPDQGGPRRPGQAPPVGAVDRLLQAPALREVPAAARAVQQGDQAGRRCRRQGQHGPRGGPEAARLHRRDRQDLLGDEGRSLTTDPLPPREGADCRVALRGGPAVPFLPSLTGAAPPHVSGETVLVSPRFDLRSLLQRVEAAAPIDAVTAVADQLAVLTGAAEVSFLIADFSGHALVRLGTATRVPEGSRTSGPESAETMPLEGTVYARVLRTQLPDVTVTERGVCMVVPVTDRGDAMGVLELQLPEPPDEQAQADIRAAGHALAYVVTATRRHTDLFEWGQRTTPFSLAAEIQRRLLPSAFTCEAGQFTLAGWLEPAAEVGGDTFDYTLDRDCLQVSITDAVGHQVAASLLATLLVEASATAAGRVSASANRPATPTTAWPRTRRPASSSPANFCT